MVIPATVIEVDESHAAFRQAPGEQAIACEGSVTGCCPVHRQGLGGLVGDVDQLGNRGLHAKGELVLGDAGVDLGIVSCSGAQAVEIADCGNQMLLAVAADAGRVSDVVNGIPCRMELHSSQFVREKAARPLARGDGLWIASAHAREDDKPRKILAQRTETIVHPGTHARSMGDDRTGVHEGVSGVVVDLLGHHRTDDGDVVGDGCDVREVTADDLAALAMAAEGGSWPHAAQFLPL